MPRVVAFDLMETLVHDPYVEALQAAFGDRLGEAMRERDPSTWPRFETGELDEAGFWEAHAEWEPDTDRFHEVRRARTTWLPGMKDLVAEVRASATVLVATNYPSWVDDVQAQLLDGLVDGIVASCRIGARKPETAYWEALVAHAEVDAADVTFIDDRRVNVDGAVDHGMNGLLFDGAEPLRDALVEVGVLPA